MSNTDTPTPTAGLIRTMKDALQDAGKMPDWFRGIEKCSGGGEGMRQLRAMIKQAERRIYEALKAADAYQQQHPPDADYDALAERIEKDIERWWSDTWPGVKPKLKEVIHAAILREHPHPLQAPQPAQEWTESQIIELMGDPDPPQPAPQPSGDGKAVSVADWLDMKPESVTRLEFDTPEMRWTVEQADPPQASVDTQTPNGKDAK